MSLKQRFYNKTALLLTLCLAAAAGHGGFARAEEVHVSEMATNVIAGTIQYETAKHLALLPQETAGVPAGVPRTLAELHLLMMSAGTRLDEEAAQLGMTRDQYVDFLAASLVSAGGGAPEPAETI